MGVHSFALWTLGTELSLSGAFCPLVPSYWPLVFFFKSGNSSMKRLHSEPSPSVHFRKLPDTPRDLFP